MSKSICICKTRGWGWVAVILGFALAATASAQVWGPAVRLTNDPDSSLTSSNNAWCVAASEDNVHVVWYDTRDGNQEIYYKRSVDNGETWGTDTRLTNAADNSRDPSIAAWGDNVHVVWDDTRDGNQEIYYKRSVDNGETWEPDTRLTDHGYSVIPSMAVWGNNIHVVWGDNRDGNFEIYYKRSVDNGQTWGADIRLTNAPDYSTFASIAAGENNIHVVWRDRRDGSQKIYYKRSEDNGETWGTDTRLTEDPDTSWYPSVAVSGSNIHVVWADERDGNDEIYYKRSTDNGQTWGADTRLTNQERQSSYPSVAVSGDSINVVWHDFRDENYEVYFKGSADNGETWGADTRLTNDPDRSFCPSIAVSGEDLHVVWYTKLDENFEIYYKHGTFGAGIAENPALSGYSLEVSSNPAAIRYSLPTAGKVNIVIADVTGRMVRTLVSEKQSAGYHWITWDACDSQGARLPFGVYFCELRTQSYSVAKKLILLQ